MVTVIGNLKGGTGKSTVTFNVAIWLLSSDREVIVYDLDPQQTLTDVAEVRKEEKIFPKLKVKKTLETIKKDIEDDKEILIDIGVSDMKAVKKALALANRIVVPIQPSQADIWATQRFLKLINEASGKKKIEVVGFVNRADTHRAVRETAETEEAIQYLPGIKHLDVRLYQRTAYRRSFSEGMAVFEMSLSSKAAKEVMQLSHMLYNG
jgi:chromosome partitioning protein